LYACGEDDLGFDRLEIFADADLGKVIFLEADFGKDFMANDLFIYLFSCNELLVG
jgi:hypothetical protein